jgi:hypothetical protein
MIINTATDTIARHRTWLDRFPAAYRAKWEQQFASAEESAMCEAHVREVLEANGAEVSPADDPAAGGPDFRCTVAGRHFYVEVTCLTRDVVTRWTNLEPSLPASRGPRSYNDLTALVRQKASKKAVQCSELDAPCLLALGTFDIRASVVCVDELHIQHILTSHTGIGMAFDGEIGESVGPVRHIVNMRDSSVLRLGGYGALETCRKPISGFLICGFGSEVWRKDFPVRGLLHPDAVRPFPRELLPRIRFCRLLPGYGRGELQPVWD